MAVANKSSSQPSEMTIRRRISNIYNKREEDFPSLKEYNDYLEEVEDMIFNLASEVDVPAIEAKIANYQQENAEQIMINQARKAEELAAALAASKGRPVNANADVISQGGFGTEAGPYAPTAAGGQPRPIPQAMAAGLGSDALGYAIDDDERIRLKAERGPGAGGWSMEFSRKRSLEEAFSSIWI